ncbi:MAG: OmpA family protein [Chlamydiia bacterium]|nr:OmpA family protein [Chlamydiia bacterium]
MKHLVRIMYAAVLLTATGCVRNSSQTWEDMKTAGRYMHRGVDAMFGKDYESRLLTSDDEFIGPYDDEFVPLRDSDLRNAYAGLDGPLPQPKGIPGQKGVPSLSEFYAPPDMLRHYFQAVHFETDDFAVKDKHEIEALLQMASYLKKNPNTYLVIMGHTDERASASYNMALGMRRANYVRSFLVKQGVDLNKIYTVSRGKEQPLALGHAPDDWSANRRSEFKIFEK